MNRMMKWMMVAALSMTLVVPYSQAQADADSAQVTQAELAQMLVNLTGLARFLPNPATPQELFAALLANGISPKDGWKPNDPVTKGTLARLIVQAMDMVDQVENPDDENSWVNLLAENGIPIDTVGAAVQNVAPTAEPVTDYVMGPATSSDPLTKQAVFGLPDEKQFGTDLEAGATISGAPARVVPPAPVLVPVTRREARRVIPVIPKPPRPTTRPTPDGGE